MDELISHIFLALQTVVMAITIYTIYYMLSRLRKDRWYFLHALPMLIYSIHVVVYYLVILVSHQVDASVVYALHAWAIALRLHGAIMVLSMARTVITCLRNC